MAPEHWALKDIIQELTIDGYRIIVETFQPCHLWFRWTTVEPQEHLIPRVVRGLPIVSDKRFCFVAFKDNEQEEEGDTLEHTFIKEPWPGCETRWFYFHGTIAGNSSPSTSAILKKHRPSGLLFIEEYTYEGWVPAYLFKEEYTLDPYPPLPSKIFTEPYTWG